MPRPKFLSYACYAAYVVFYAIATVCSILCAWFIVGVLARVL